MAGCETRCMGLESCNGQMVKNSKVNSNQIREMGGVSSLGLMDDRMKEDGVMVSRMVMVFIKATMGK